jgi:hypothetical protein
VIIPSGKYKDAVALMDEGFEAPMTYGGGLSYTYDNRLALAFDYMKQNWSDVLYYNKVGTLRDRTKMSMGVEYRHNELSRNYAERMYWRVGASLIDSYVPNANGLDFSVSMGIGLPLRMSATVVNAAIEYNRRTSMVNIQENCLKLVVNVSVYIPEKLSREEKQRIEEMRDMSAIKPTPEAKERVWEQSKNIFEL